jgi:hypothetical protein
MICATILTPQLWNGTQEQDAAFQLKLQVGYRMRVPLWVFHGNGGDMGERNTENLK